MKFAGDVVAVARLTLIESWRRKVWIIVLLFAGVLLVSAGLFGIPADFDQRMRLVVVWSIRATTIFSVVLSVFVVATALPGDFEHRRIYVLATKPVSKLAIYLGRFAGFGMALAAFVASAAVLSMAYLAIVPAIAGRTAESLQARPHRYASSVEGQGPERTTQQTTDGKTAALNAGRGGVGKLVWEVRGLGGADLEEEFPVVLHVDVGLGDYQGGYGTTAQVRVVNPGTGASWSPPEPVAVHAGVERRLAVPLSAVGPADVLVVEASPAVLGYYLIGGAEDVWVLEEARPYALNLVKGYGLTFLAGLVLLSVTLAASAWLSAPVSMLLGMFVFVAGMSAGGIEESLETTERTIREAQRAQEESVEFTGHTGDLKVPLWGLQYSYYVSTYALAVIPHFSRADPREYLLEGKDLSLGGLARALLWSLPYWGVPLLVGLLLIRFREFR